MRLSPSEIWEIFSEFLIFCNLFQNIAQVILLPTYIEIA